jgi:hypothetical protein
VKTPIELIKQQIRLAEQSLILQREAGMAEDFAVLFTGNWHDSIPRNLILNQQLSPVEKITWQTLRLTIANPQQPGSAPSREGLAAMVNCSPPTITSSRQMLRLTRYMTHCSTVRKQGRFVGDIYLLHDEPMALSDTLQIDPEYLDFVVMLTKAGNKAKALRQEAARVLREIDQIPGMASPTPIEAMAVRIQAGVESYPTALARRDASVRKTLPVNATEKLTSKIFAFENIESTESHQRKNFTLDGVLTNTVNFQSKQLENNDFHQSKNFTLGYFLNDSDQSKIFTLVKSGFCSVCCSGNNKYINTNARMCTCVRDKEGKTGDHNSEGCQITNANSKTPHLDNDFNQFMSHMGLQQDAESLVQPELVQETSRARPVERKAWELSDSEIENICRPVRSAATHPQYKPPELVSRAAPSAITPRGVNPNYTSITETSDHENAMSDSISGFLDRVKTAFPELNYRAIDRYVCIAFVNFIQGQLPFLIRILQSLSDIERRDVLAQYMARRASYVHGWNNKDISNPIGFIKTLIERLKTNDFVLDSMGSEFVLAIANKRAPVIEDTHEMRRLNATYSQGEINYVSQ